MPDVTHVRGAGALPLRQRHTDVRGDASGMVRPRYGVPDTASRIRRPECGVATPHSRRDRSRGTQPAGQVRRDASRRGCGSTCIETGAELRGVSRSMPSHFRSPAASVPPFPSAAREGPARTVPPHRSRGNGPAVKREERRRIPDAVSRTQFEKAEPRGSRPARPHPTAPPRHSGEARPPRDE